MEKVLITGGAGFIGSTLAKRVAMGSEVYVVDDLSMGKLSNLGKQPNIHFIEGSVTDEKLMSEVLTDHQFDYIFHLAAIASVADSVARPVETHKVNFDSVLLLLEMCREKQKQLKRLVFSSSAAVYGDEATLPKQEESVIRPLTPYAVDKFAAEQYVLDYQHLYGLPTSAVRFFNVYGPNQNPDSPYSGVISIMIDKYQKTMRGEKGEFTIFGDGSQSRDFIYIDDVVDALLLVARSDQSLGRQYNVGTGVKTTLLDLIESLNAIFSVALPVIHGQARSGDIKESYADISKLRGLGFSDKYTVSEGLRKYADSIK